MRSALGGRRRQKRRSNALLRALLTPAVLQLTGTIGRNAGYMTSLVLEVFDGMMVPHTLKSSDVVTIRQIQVRDVQLHFIVLCFC